MRVLGILLIFVGVPLCIAPMIGVPLIVIGLFMIVAGFGSSNANKTAKALATQMKNMPQPVVQPAASNADTDKWAALAKYDDDIRQAVGDIMPLGTTALAKLRTTYLALNDKSKLSAIVADIKAEFGA